jgi:signal peptidase I
MAAVVSFMTKLAAILALFSCAVWFFWLRPTSLGGPATYIIVDGLSMEPTYHNGDLVILHKSDTYAMGDIVAYATSDFFQTGRLVIHRIVGQDAQGFITRGDNRQNMDPWRPTAAQIRGAAWITIPSIGKNLATLAQPGNLRIFLIALLILFVAGGKTGRRVRRRHGSPRQSAVLAIRAGHRS